MIKINYPIDEGENLTNSIYALPPYNVHLQTLRNQIWNGKNITHNRKITTTDWPWYVGVCITNIRHGGKCEIRLYEKGWYREFYTDSENDEQSETGLSIAEALRRIKTLYEEMPVPSTQKKYQQMIWWATRTWETMSDEEKFSYWDWMNKISREKILKKYPENAKYLLGRKKEQEK